MSAVRRLDARSQVRKTQSSPYARPQAQNSRWSLSSFLEPIRRRVFGEATESEASIGRGRQIERSLSPPPAGLQEEPSYGSIYTNRSGTEPPRSPSKSASPKRPPPREGITPTATVENVLDWLTDATGSTLKREDVHTVVDLIHKGIPTERTVTGSLSQNVGRPLGAIEVEGMISLLRKQMPRAPSEPFRFKTSTPSREPTPTTTIPGPRKMLTKNPNGTYRWQGAGSSKVTPRRNRYGSPAFGSSNVTPSKTKFASGATSIDPNLADGKRRRVESGDSSYFAPPATSSPQPTPPADSGLPFPIASTNSRPSSNVPPTSAPPTKITIPPAPVVAPPRLRTPTFKPSLPSQPSPLRNAWTGSPDSSVEEISVGNLSPPKHQPTQAASFMSELIEKVTPAKKPDDLTNPYQTASPIAKVGPPRRSTRRTRPARPAIADVQEDKNEEDDKVEEKKATADLPPEAIFTATLPKGSKRSRPPANFEKPAAFHRSPSPVSNGSSQDAQMEDYTVEEADEDRTSKKKKGLNGLASPPSRTSDIVIEEVEVDESGATSCQPTVNGSATNGLSSRPFGGFKPTAVPSRPSKLRFSYQAEVSAPSSPTSQPDADPVSKSSTMDLDAPPPPSLNTSFSFTPKATPSGPAPAASSPLTTASKPAASTDPKSRALSQTLKVFAFSIPVSSIPTKHLAAAEKAKAQPIPSLPTFDFSAPTPGAGPSKTATSAFNWAAAGMKPVAPAASKWTCGLCGLQSPDSAKDCTVCEAPRPAAKAEQAPKSTGFNWAAAGMKAPAVGSSKWKCTVCDLENPEDVKDKCTVCETLRPGAKPDPPKSSGGFNWAAAGVNPPPAASGSQWTCSLCALKNPDSAAKCTICDTPR